MKQIIKHLHELNVLHQELIRLGEQKQTTIVENKVDELSTLVKSESNIARTIVAIEQKWKQAAERFIQQNGWQLSDELTISELAKLISDDEDRADLLKAQKMLVDTLERLKQLNQQNQQLLEQALAFVNYSLDLMTDIPDDYTYKNPDSAANPSVRKGIFDTKA